MHSSQNNIWGEDSCSYPLLSGTCESQHLFMLQRPAHVIMSSSYASALWIQQDWGWTRDSWENVRRALLILPLSRDLSVTPVFSSALAGGLLHEMSYSAFMTVIVFVLSCQPGPCWNVKVPASRFTCLHASVSQSVFWEAGVLQDALSRRGSVVTLVWEMLHTGSSCVLGLCSDINTSERSSHTSVLLPALFLRVLLHPNCYVYLFTFVLSISHQRCTTH